MRRVNRILWGEGMFLRPQHFQQQELFIEQRIADTLRAVHAHPWGIRAALVDEDALGSGLLRVDRLDAVYQDGTHVRAPEFLPLPQARNLADIPQLGTEAVIFACLPVLNPFGGNTSDGGIETRPARFTNALVTVPDLFTNALETEITALHANVRILLEPENRDGYHCIAIARIRKSPTGAWTSDPSFIPPLLTVHGSPALGILLRRLLDILLVKSQALSAAHRERVKSIVEYGTSDISSFWLLHTVNRAFPLLSHMALAGAHPEALYTALAQLCGELMTFSSTLSLTDIPPYDHLELPRVFEKIDAMLRELLETVVSNRYAVIPLVNTKPSFFVGRLDSERLVDKVDFYLSVSSGLPAAQLLDVVPTKLKMGSPDDVEKILNSALPGARLVHALQTPASMPVRVGNHYFAVEPQGQIFERMLKARSICIYVPQTLLELKLELIAVFR
ncbi:type VI secretion system baseplate subunit TssK [Noviherbaspirillum denitrificans]|uniref:Type VI secretion protein n=1 Tax=Noviherbaspirillum denitrificans TaxID=1968433 RepID=A0A254T924_9BURK|nr:type VI secretion system baseplate subunit TssK [Noviherbaspirillum denitrificans]OWW19075.1 type VI secretion protein [Noviherbaspirillum denitrificans]